LQPDFNDLVRETVNMANPTPAGPFEDVFEPVDDSVTLIDFGRCVKSYEVEATALSRGFKTALFIQQFKSGLLRVDDQKALRVQ
jgi:hypothetical protein